MQIKQSVTLQRHLRLGSLEAQRTGILSLTADVAFLSVLKDGNSHAGRILGQLLKDWEIYQIGVRVERDSAKAVSKGHNKKDPRESMTPIIEGIEQARIAAGGGEGETSNTGHFLLWIMGNRKLVSCRVMELYGVTPEQVMSHLRSLPGNEDFHVDLGTLERYVAEKLISYSDQETEKDRSYDGGQEYEEGDTVVKTRKAKKSLINKYAVNMTEAARHGTLDPVIGRDREIERVVQILGRRKKNNPILVGEAGVGKSAIAEGLARLVASREVPSSLRDKEIYSLDVASLVAGTKYRGQFEERIKALLDELTQNRNIILFIDEIHTIVGAGSTQGSLDTANILKPALARGEIQCIGATTLDEFRENIESDGALERRFQKVLVEPATREQTLRILDNIKDNYERHHYVRYTPEAIAACVDLTDRYITDRYFPDKAIDVMDEAGSKVRLTTNPEPRLIHELEEQIGQAVAVRQRAMGEVNYERAAAARMRVVSLRAKLIEYRSDWLRQMEENPFVVGVEHIEEVITSMTGIPVERVSQGEKKRLGAMGDHLAGRVIGQDTAVGKVARSIQRSRAGLKDPNKPIGVFMFVGPTGVGKTHLTKELSKWMFDRPDALIRIDMSEYSEKHNVSRMIGSPPGYVGYNEGGQLTEAVRRQPYAVVLFDEIEKAHPDVFNIMLQIFDDGQLTDGTGRKVDFRNTVIIMTSNVGSRAAAKKLPSVGYSTANKQTIETVNKTADYRDALNSTFAPEFINRIDDIVVFNTLSEEDVERIVDLETGELIRRATSLGYELKIRARARRLLARMGYEPRYGVRSLKRTILDKVEEPLAAMIVSGQLERGDTVLVGCRSGNIELTVKQKQTATEAA